MKLVKILFVGITIVITGIVAYFLYHTNKTVVFNPGPEFVYKGLVNVKKMNYQKLREFIVLTDSTHLAVTTLLPKKKKERNFPTVLIYTPYSGSVVIPEMSMVDKFKSKFALNIWGPDYEVMLNPKVISTLVSNGYAITMVDMRGTGSSTGNSAALDPIHIQDSKEVLQWIAEQDWSNGNIGMMGLSYYGWSQFAAASTKSPHLKAIAPEVIFYDAYSEAIRPGGIYATKWLTEYSKMIEFKNKNLWNTSYPAAAAYPSEPVVDEDKDSELKDEIPILELNQNDLNYYLKDNIEFRDGRQSNESYYVSMTKEHYSNLSPVGAAEQIIYYEDSISFGNRTYGLDKISVAQFIKDIKETEIPVLIIGGFFDGFSKGTLMSAASLIDSNKTYVFMTPRFHLPGMSKEYWEFFNYQYSHLDQRTSMLLQFFDKYLKEIDNNLDKKPPIRIYTAFDGWEYFDSWPPEGTVPTKWYINKSRMLQTTKPKDSAFHSYDIDFTHSSSYNQNRINPMQMYMASDSLLLRNKLDKKCLVFESPTLKEELKVTGHPRVLLQITSNQKNADLYVYLSDVDSTGNVHYVSETKLRTNWHKTFNNDGIVNYQYDVKPDIPWHSFRREDFVTNPLKIDSVTPIELSMQPISWKFRKGHKVRIAIAGADLENYELNPYLCNDNNPEKCKPTVLTIRSNNQYQSYIELPIRK
ncbi:CocE/NonD family hydrolase [Aquimarina intermedia]|uniref:Putative CocE/NonD family hydrolase n=1 Tax=Aquimarina intermedia TaxID=350814 RepID=A0A5S5CAB3_9FLAO|nr:CocE/NonD family hydrolase [Aquimarina intermedia]TYP75306.1 putative CocE/NonD family hydrolase [Aquimarina intermedia]